MSEHIADYEACLLLSLITDSSKIPQCNLLPDEFSNSNYAEIYRAIESLTNRGDAVDIIQVADELNKQTGKNWFGVLKGIAQAISTTQNIDKYTSIIRRSCEQRKGALIAQTLIESINDEGAIDHAIRDLMALTLPGKRRQYDFKAMMKLAVTELDESFNGNRKGVSTGLIDLDEKLGGLHNGDLVVIGARPAMGKTAFLLNMAISAGKDGHSIGIFSGEQDIIQIGQRVLSIAGKAPIMRMRNGKMLDEDWPKVSAGTLLVKDFKGVVDDTPSPSLSHVVRSARTWKYANNMSVLYIDYLQRMQTDSKQKRYETVGENVRGLKNLARELNIPIVVLAQVNRTVEARADKRPGMGDLADSSEIEKEADQILCCIAMKFTTMTRKTRVLPRFLSTRTGTAQPDMFARHGWANVYDLKISGEHQTNFNGWRNSAQRPGFRGIYEADGQKIGPLSKQNKRMAWEGCSYVVGSYCMPMQAARKTEG